MKRIALGLLLVCFALAPASLKADTDADKELVKKLQGSWLVVSVKSEGEKASDAEIKKMKIVIEGNKMTFVNGDSSEVTTFEVDASKKPAWLDGKHKDAKKPVLGIVKLDGDSLEICSFKSEDKRPKAFESEKGSEAVLLVAKRAKK